MPGGEAASTAVGGVLDHEDGRHAQLAARSHPLRRPEQHQGGGGEHADRSEPRKQCNGRRRSRHHEDHGDEYTAPTMHVPPPAEEKSPERTQQEGRAVDRECREEDRGLLFGGEENWNDGRPEGSIDGEVIPFHCVSHAGRTQRPPRAGWRLRDITGYQHPDMLLPPYDREA
jgi:hypothetical protein